MLIYGLAGVPSLRRSRYAYNVALSLSPTEERVLGILTERARLDVEQIAGVGLLSVETASRALDSLVESRIVTRTSGEDGAQAFELNRRVLKDMTAAA